MNVYRRRWYFARTCATFRNVILNKASASWGILFATLRAIYIDILDDLVNAKLQFLKGTEGRHKR
jgi:hypothetical protein